MGIEQIPSIESMGSVPLAIAAVAYLLIAGWGAGRLLRVIVFVVAGLHVVGVCGVCLGMTGGLAESRSLILLGVFTVIGIGEAYRSRMLAVHIGNLLRFCDWKPSPSWIVVVPFLLLTLGPAMNYPTGWDELVYGRKGKCDWLHGQEWNVFPLYVPTK